MSHDRRLRFGAFIAPFHPPHENPYLAYRRDVELVEHMDRLGFEEVWIGEHHSAGYELIASPELFIAAVAERTRDIRLGTGVVSLPYHHPLMVADRINQLDHMTRGRVMFGVGPGSLPSDAFMMGIEVQSQRDRMDEAIGVLVPLLSGETVSHESDWFTLREARLQLRPFTEPHVEIAVASQVSPAGARAAGKHGLSLLSLGATSTGGFNALASNWQICTDKAAEHGRTIDRRNWRLVGPMHIAETKDQAREDVRHGLEDWLRYFREVAALPLAPPGGVDAAIDALNASGFAVIGGPEDAAAQLEKCWEQSGGFGVFLFLAHNWASFERTKHSYELFARYVAPRFQGLCEPLDASMEWAVKNRPAFIGALTQAIGTELQKHNQEQAARNPKKAS